MMKKVIILLIIIGYSTCKADIITTAQYSDIIKFKGKEYALNSNPLEQYFDKHPDLRPESSSTALWRGYVAYFEIIENQLYVVDLKRPNNYVDSEGEYQREWVSIYKSIFPDNEKVKIDWYSGILILPYGDLVNYVHMGYASTYSNYWLLEIENGNFNEARKYTNKKFINFKLRQFRKFKQTKDYKNIFKELKENFNEDNKFIESFISDYITNYTTKFLID